MFVVDLAGGGNAGDECTILGAADDERRRRPRGVVAHCSMFWVHAALTITVSPHWYVDGGACPRQESFAACSSSTSVGTGMVCTVLGAPSGSGCGCGCWFSRNGSSAANFPNVSVVICRFRSLRQRFQPLPAPLRHQPLLRSAQVSC